MTRPALSRTVLLSAVFALATSALLPTAAIGADAEVRPAVVVDRDADARLINAADTAPADVRASRDEVRSPSRELTRQLRSRFPWT